MIRIGFHRRREVRDAVPGVTPIRERDLVDRVHLPADIEDVLIPFRLGVTDGHRRRERIGEDGLLGKQVRIGQIGFPFVVVSLAADTYGDQFKSIVSFADRLMTHDRGNGIHTGILVVIVAAKAGKACLLQKRTDVMVRGKALLCELRIGTERGSREPQRSFRQIVIVYARVGIEPGTAERNVQRMIFLRRRHVKRIDQIDRVL